MTTRKLTIKEDEKGLFVKFLVFKDHWLIVRPGAPDWVGGERTTFKKNDKVNVSYYNMNMGFFMVKKVGDRESRCIWQGPSWEVDKFRGEWIGEQTKKI